MTKAKALFFDIDGTLVSFNTHVIPESAVEALQRAKAAGYYGEWCALCCRQRKVWLS